jgi:CubicO group peptidase (beta-lactamase class C family)
MKRKALVAIAVVVLAAGLFFLVMGFSEGHPMRQAIGILFGPDALAYREPRNEVVLEPGPPQPTLAPGEAGIDTLAIQEAVDYAAKRNSRALVIGRNGHIVFEKYWDDAGLDSPVELSGFTPVLAALVLGTAQQNGEIKSIDLPLANYQESWRDTPLAAITLRQLLTGNSGLASASGRPWPGSLAADYHLRENQGANLRYWPLEAAPAAGESPADMDAEILSLMLTDALGTNYRQLLAERLWKPIGGGSFSVGIDGHYSSAGHTRAGCCLGARLSDWLRIGTLIANGGVFEGNQFLPPAYAQFMVSPTHKDSPRAVFMRTDGSFSASDVVRLEAAGKQRMWMVPSLKLVIIRVGDEPPASAGWSEEMIPDAIIRGTSGRKPGSAGEGVDPNKFAPH